MSGISARVEVEFRGGLERLLICSPPPNTIPETAASGLHVAGRAAGFSMIPQQVELFQGLTSEIKLTCSLLQEEIHYVPEVKQERSGSCCISSPQESNNRQDIKHSHMSHQRSGSEQIDWRSFSKLIDIAPSPAISPSLPLSLSCVQRLQAELLVVKRYACIPERLACVETNFRPKEKASQTLEKIKKDTQPCVLYRLNASLNFSYYNQAPKN